MGKKKVTSPVKGTEHEEEKMETTSKRREDDDEIGSQLTSIEELELKSEERQQLLGRQGSQHTVIGIGQTLVMQFDDCEDCCHRPKEALIGKLENTDTRERRSAAVSRIIRPERDVGTDPAKVFSIIHENQVLINGMDFEGAKHHQICDAVLMDTVVTYAPKEDDIPAEHKDVPKKIAA